MADLAASSYGVAQSGQGPEPSSTQSHPLTPGTLSRMPSMRSVNAPWKTTAMASAFSHR
jgi:hypothetical protein